MQPHGNTLSKRERIYKQQQVDRLFSADNPSANFYPLRIVYLLMHTTTPPTAQILVSVPKRRLHHAVDRNRVKRQIREAYRLNKHPLLTHLKATHQQLYIAFIWIGKALNPQVVIETKMRQVITYITALNP